MPETAERRLVVPSDAEWLAVQVPEVDTKLYCGTHVYSPAHTITVAPRYPTFEDGKLLSDKTQVDMAQFLREYNAANGTLFGGPALFEDEAVRAQLGKDHAVFDENFNRNDTPWRWGYVLDFSKPYGNGAEGIGQSLVTRIVGYRLKDGDVELGVSTFAPDGMVPSLSREQLEKRIGAEGLKLLGKLRGKEVYEKPSEIVDVRNALGYPQFTLDHETMDEHGKLLPHTHHSYRPEQNYSETVGVRRADWGHRGGHSCFRVDLDADAGDSDPDGSVPLVRGGIFGAKMDAIKEYRATF